MRALIAFQWPVVALPLVVLLVATLPLAGCDRAPAPTAPTARGSAYADFVSRQDALTAGHATCTTSADCGGGPCLKTAVRSVCTDLCTVDSECDPGWSCTRWVGIAGVTSYCAPGAPTSLAGVVR